MDNEKRRRFLALITAATSTDDLFDLEARLGPLDETDPDSEEIGHQILAMTCLLSGGPAPARERFSFEVPAPRRSESRFEVRGRMEQRTVRIIWADGRLYGSRYALARLTARALDWSDADVARARLRAAVGELPAGAGRPRDPNTRASPWPGRVMSDG